MTILGILMFIGLIWGCAADTEQEASEAAKRKAAGDAIERYYARLHGHG